MASFSLSDLQFLLDQIRIAEAHASGQNLRDLIPNTELPFGLRTVDGSFNHLVEGQTEFGAADNTFPRMLEAAFRNDQDGDTFDANGPADGGLITNTDYNVSGDVVDADPRLISNLIVDQTANNPAAYAAAYDPGPDGVLGTTDDVLKDGIEIVTGTRADGSTFETFFIPNTAPDEGLSASFNAWMTFFGQFFDHGLDLVTKGGNGMVFMPLQDDDPLVLGADGILGTPDDLPAAQRFMVLTRATNQPGPDGVLGTADDIHEHTNTTSPFVDQNQTYTSHPAHQVFLRAYELNADGDPVPTGKLIENPGTGGMATWAAVKAQARDLLGIDLSDYDALSVPLVAVDPYGNFVPGASGFAQLVVDLGPDGLFGTADDVLVEGNPAAPVSPIAVSALRTGHAFLDDIAHAANPVNAQTGALLTADSDDAIGLSEPGTYDDELLDAHYIAGDGRVNENIALTAVHHVFHSEHNRQVDEIKATILASGDAAFIAEWQLADGSWNGERLFQAAKFATEMQYQHLVFEEFARTIQPQVDIFLDFDDTINPSIVAEFAHTVYRFGHSMLTETVDRLDPDFQSSEIGLIQAFLNPLAFAASGPTPDEAAGAIVRGVTRQVGNEIDEFVTEALRNNLLGLPLDLPAINLARGRDTGIPSLNAARREFYEGTGDSQLKPYTSWADFAQHLKHPESLINFIAAYGTHATVVTALTLADKRAAATLLVLGGVEAPGDRLDFLNSTGAYASGADGVTVTGLDDVDFWVGGLAEEIMPFGGMLGSTFNFVFETQLEALQNGDRLYYLHRTAGMDFLAELENNSFSKMVMANTDVTHLPALIFQTPGFTLEVDPDLQFTGLGVDGRDDPAGVVIRNNPATPGADTNYLRYTGDEHVVLGGTAGNDVMISGIGDDTLYGDEGNDRLEGGHGNDDIQGGPGDDIITDIGGDDVIKGGDGNDVIHGGQGLNLIIAGPGQDFIVTGEDANETFAGAGNDFILGSRLDAFPNGNEGDDWLEIGLQDGAAGDNFDPLGLDLIPGNDVFLGDGGFDESLGEGGDDIVVGSEGPDKHKLASGFDWVTFKNDGFGVNADMFKNAFNDAPLPESVASIGNRYAQVEGLSGSAFADILRGDDADAAQIAAAGAKGSVLTNLDLITGLRAFLGSAAAGADGVTGTADDRFDAGNIILGGDGGDLIEGRAGNDLIDGDNWLNVRISVRQNADGTGPEIRTVNSMADLVPDMLSGAINPGQLQIVREILTATGPDFDTAVFSGRLIDYDVTTVGGVTTVAHLDATAPNGIGIDGVDRLTNIERLQFADQSLVLVPGLNNEPVGQVAILDATNTPDDTPVVGQILRASIAGVTDADNGTVETPGAATPPVTYIWQFERVPGSGRFEDISVNLAPRGAPSAVGPTLTVTPELQGLALRVKAHYQDANGVLETVFSAPTALVGEGTPPPPPPPLFTDEQPGVASPGVHFLGSDLQFILDQIVIAERHAAGEDLASLLPNIRMAMGLRTVDGSLNNLVQNQTEFGAADNVFPRMLEPDFRDAEAGTSYTQTSGLVVDSQPRIISNLIVDQTANNPAAYALAYDPGADGTLGTTDDVLREGVEIVTGTRTDGSTFETFFIPNVAPDEGLSASFNAWFTFFGQFFDHGLDLVTKGGSGTVFMPLQEDDPLFNPDSPTNFMVLTRATNLPGDDGILGTADDIHEHTNTTSPFVDQNQTYASHPSHQVFLRAYELNADGAPEATGKLIVNRDLGADGLYGTPDDTVIGGMATWAVVKAQARDLLGINLTDADVNNLPLLATDAYGNFLRGPSGGVQVVMVGPDGLPGTADDVLVEGNPGAPLDLTNAVRTGHAFLDDIAHAAAPRNSSGTLLTPDADTVAGGPVAAGEYDDELLDAHYIAGDGRVNENIGLTTVHHVFHAEHNRLVDHTKEVALATGDVDFLNQWLLTPVTEIPTTPAAVAALDWNGERLFQAAKFGTEMQYQHLVFEEFARTMQPNIDVFIPNLQNYQTEIDPSIVAEFAHTVYRFGHSMLLETVDRLDPSFQSTELGLIQAFLNPLEFAASGLTPEAAAGAIVRGVTRQTGNAIDEFVTEALRNNLLGLPLDLPAINLARGRDTGIPSLNEARRQFYEMTGDSQLTPYTSWADFALHLKHPESLINFIAAYGAHDSVTGATTLAAKRAAATLLVLGGDGAPGDRLDFLNSTGAYASVGGVTTTGLDTVDFWIGGLAEAITPFGGMLGPTFNFVFETQLESLQNGDRFYYLERTAGLNFVTELENNSFAKMIMAHTDVTHLSGIVFQTNLTLEVDPTLQAEEDPVGDSSLIPLVIRNNPATSGADTNYLQYTGDEHVVLGGTPGDDIVISSIGDDTLWGDAGDDRLEGGDGNDQLRGGTGHDILTDSGGDDNIQGDDGNDVIHAGNGVNLVLGGFGKDFIVTGEDASEAFGGPGNDFILGGDTNEQDMGNEGDDWLERGLLDGSPGDNFDPLGTDRIIGNDVFVGSGGPDIMNAEGGDDIMVGSNGPGDKYLGASGFDWATFKDGTTGVDIDLDIRALNAAPVPAAAGILARFSAVEGLAGSTHSDILSGDNADAAVIAQAGAQGSVLTNIGLIDGLQDFLGAGVTSFGSGNIILGGDGSDLIEGRGGNDLIDGDKWLNVRISVRQNVDGTGPEIASFDSMVPLVPFMLNGTYNPGQLVIAREILPGDGGFNFDTAVFSGNLADYEIQFADPSDPNRTTVVTHLDVNGPDGIGVDGIDRLTNIERLQFGDQAVVLVEGLNNEPVGLLTVNDTTPRVGQVLTVSAAGVTDADNPGAITGAIRYVWQFEARPDTGVFEDIRIVTGVGDEPATGPSFTVPPELAGLRIRAKAVYLDGHGVLETVFSGPTDPVTGSDPDLTLVGTAGNDVLTGAGGNDTITGLAGNDILTGLLGADTLIGNGGADTLDGGGGNDTLQGGAGADTLIGGTGADLLQGGAGNDTLDGGTGIDTLVGGLGDDTFVVDDLLDTVQENVDGGTDTIRTSLNVFDLAFVSNVENLSFNGGIEAAAVGGVGNGDFTGTGTDVANVIEGGDGNDTLLGLGGNDTLDGGLGNDTLEGGLGADTLTGGAGVDTLLGGAGADTLNGDANNDTLLGGAGADTLNGGAGDDALSGEAGADTLNGGAGNDTLDGGAGNDALNGQGGDDTLIVDSAGDTVNGGAGIDTVLASVGNFTLGANTENLNYTGTGAFLGTGNALNNVITGGDLADTLNGLGGNDTLNGAGGNDTLNGGDGNDTLNGGAGVDSLAGGAGADTLTGGAGADNLNGGAGADSLFGGAGNDTLLGGDGVDTLTGGAGNDIMNGGAGNDVFIFDAGFGSDTIQGFDANPANGQDRLDISALGITDFAASVTIIDQGANTLVNINYDGVAGVDGSIQLVGVNGTAPNVITQADFLL